MIRQPRVEKPARLPGQSKTIAEPLAIPELVVETLLQKAREDAQAIRERARAETRKALQEQQSASARLAAQQLRLVRHETQADERTLERSIKLARVLAERLLGNELELHPQRISELARTALKEVRGARRIRIVCNPDDAPYLERSLADFAPAEYVLEVHHDSLLARTCLRFISEHGVLEGDLGIRLDALAHELKIELHSHE